MKLKLRHPAIGTFALSVEPGAPLVLGRDLTSADLEITWDPHVSRRHARLWVEHGVCWFMDLGSKNGSFRNGWRLEGAVELRPGEPVSMGDTTLELQDPASAPSDEVTETRPQLRTLPRGAPPADPPIPAVVRRSPVVHGAASPQPVGTEATSPPETPVIEASAPTLAEDYGSRPPVHRPPPRREASRPILADDDASRPPVHRSSAPGDSAARESAPVSSGTGSRSGSLSSAADSGPRGRSAEGPSLRFVASHRVRIEGAGLQTLWLSELAHRRLFVPGEVPLRRGTRVWVDLTIENELFEIPAEIVHLGVGPRGATGAGLALGPLPGALRAHLEDGVDETSLDTVEIEPPAQIFSGLTSSLADLVREGRLEPAGGSAAPTAASDAAEPEESVLSASGGAAEPPVPAPSISGAAAEPPVPDPSASGSAAEAPVPDPSASGGAAEPPVPAPSASGSAAEPPVPAPSSWWGVEESPRSLEAEDPEDPPPPPLPADALVPLEPLRTGETPTGDLGPRALESDGHAPTPAGPSKPSPFPSRSSSTFSSELAEAARRLIRLTAAGRLYEAIGCRPETSDVELAAELEVWSLRVSDAHDHAELAEVLEPLARAINLIQARLGSVQRRLQHDFERGYVLAEHRRALADRGEGPSLPRLDSAWRRVYPAKSDRARALLGEAERAEAAGRADEAQRLREQALALAPFSLP